MDISRESSKTADWMIGLSGVWEEKCLHVYAKVTQGSDMVVDFIIAEIEVGGEEREGVAALDAMEKGKALVDGDFGVLKDYVTGDASDLSV